MSIPAREECEKLLEDFFVPPNVIRHSRQVAKIAVFIAEHLKDKGVDIDVHQVEAAGLLHDIARVAGFKDSITSVGENPTDEALEFRRGLQKRYSSHALAGFELLKDDHPEIAKIVKKHGYSSIISSDPTYRPMTWEEKVVSYADKRVAHESIVTLKQRFSEGRKRWRKSGDGPVLDLDRIDGMYFKLEDEIFSVININPDKIQAYLGE